MLVMLAFIEDHMLVKCPYEAVGIYHIVNNQIKKIMEQYFVGIFYF